MTAVDTGSVESAVTYETQQHGDASLRSARGQPARDTEEEKEDRRQTLLIPQGEIPEFNETKHQ